MSAAARSVFDFQVVPLAAISDLDRVAVVGDGLVAGGLPVVEVALRGDLGLAALEQFANRGDLTVGAGTVLSVDQARKVLDLGASFVVTPGLDPEVVKFVQDAGVPIIPGTLTPSEIQAARAMGLHKVKLFPAGNFGGLNLIKAYAGVFRDMQFMPSGGVNPATVADYLAHPSVFAASGSWIVEAPSVDEIAALAAQIGNGTA
ncbi:2-dehydro-3-deoxyphosphogluconate aldolase/(4S)-4-hydroxy-2-oxoglutarate aldolase [Leucobacter exalbidus]|uniref:2-dehydro-3-deoxyphosphogluconate aldolase/(4S)-4-hydroxy-2-oxoglutarate aldolase n=1 Tax=Leucobacter exalbidus TaxID=662960 RepID=A0A940T6A5_9MICO|nr:bifunctional 4-hydroxy-2-oxoglutarate aldolase/2-dehydro-3-deoxy-phosphogluconate aldolase [Leucobacter exalbidus]MBP1326806.1 2-dehydro-3-deoxyphosphogluconate aldolase/(4S)-4-hydroxy-2-oxoglutarate aldolase [Leucobacter exalbidus]